jgi:hypothetical protein
MDKCGGEELGVMEFEQWFHDGEYLSKDKEDLRTAFLAGVQVGLEIDYLTCMR